MHNHNRNLVEDSKNSSVSILFINNKNFEKTSEGEENQRKSKRNGLCSTNVTVPGQ